MNSSRLPSGIAEEECPGAHRWEARRLGRESQCREPLSFAIVAARWDLEGEMIERRFRGFVAIKSRPGKDVPLIVDQRQQLRVSVLTQRRVECLDCEERDGRLTPGLRVRAELVARVLEELGIQERPGRTLASGAGRERSGRFRRRQLQRNP